MLSSWKYRGRGDGGEQGNQNPERSEALRASLQSPGRALPALGGGHRAVPALCPCSAPRRLLRASSWPPPAV